MATKEAVDEKQILKLWRDINFAGSFRGLNTFQAVLKTDKNINISKSDLYKILRKEPLYLIHQLKPYRAKTRPTVTHNYGELVQADLAYMFESDPTKAKYFLLLVDVFSDKIFVEVLNNKEAATVAKALEAIFKRFGAPIYEIQTDKGTEFTGKPCRVLFQKYRIVFRTKRGLRKSSFAESSIFRVKRKLYIYLRIQLSKNWKECIQDVVNSLNNIPLKRLGYLKPSSITNVTSSVLVDQSLKEHNLIVPTEPTFRQQLKNQQEYEAKAK